MVRYKTNTTSHTMKWGKFSPSIQPTNGSIAEKSRGGYTIITVNPTEISVMSRSCILLKKINKASQIVVGHRSAADFKRMVSGNMIKFWYQYKNAHTIFGPDIGPLRGKTVRKTETVMSDYEAIPR